MKILFILSILCFCSVINADVIRNDFRPRKEFVIPWQADGNTEINRNLTSPLHVNIFLTHTYKRFDSISILPDEYYGISELYTLSFYEDMDLEIENGLRASWYRVRFKAYYNQEITPFEIEPIPEPATLILFSVLFVPLLRKKRI